MIIFPCSCITIKYTSPRDVAFFNVEKLRDTACKILDLLDDYSITENPILFHIFSNNGSYVYSNIVEVLTSGDGRYFTFYHGNFDFKALISSEYQVFSVFVPIVPIFDLFI